MKKLLSLIVLSLVMMTGLAWAQTNLINETIQDWTTHSSYGTYTQTISAGTVSMAQCIVQPSAAASGIGSIGRVQMQKENGILELPELPSIGTAEFNIVAGGANRKIKLQKLSGSTWEDLIIFSGIGTTCISCTYAVNSPSAAKIRLAAPDNPVYVHDIIVTSYGTTVQDPTLTVAPSNLSNFTYTEGAGPSNIQSFTVRGNYLNADIKLTVDSNFEIALDNEGSFTDALTLTRVDQVVENTTVYVRMVAGLDAGGYTGNVTVSSADADGQTITLSGYVLGPKVEGDYYVDFEGDGETKSAYASGTINLSGLDWNLTEALVDSNDNSDWKNGNRSVRLRGYGTSSMTMLENKANGLGTISFLYRNYTSDSTNQVDWKVEYSTDNGESWAQIGETFTHTGSEVLTFNKAVNVKGNVRIRIKRATESGSANKRLNIDDILMTSCYDYNTGSDIDVDGLGTVTFTTGNANNSGTALPPIPNTSISDYKSLALDLVGSGPWTIEIMSTLDYCSYNWQNNWYDAQTITGGFTIHIDPLTKGAQDLFIVLSKQNPTLPIELSSFTVAQNSNGNPVISWDTQSETGVNGFYIYRGVNKNITDAALISNLVPATNSSLAHSYSFVDKDLIEDGTYYYWLNVSDLNGHESYYGPAELNYAFTESEETTPEVTYNTALRSIYPNPFNPSANIGFELAEAGEVNISVYNTRGQLVRSFAPFTHEMGQGSIVWDGKDNSGNSTSSGIYLFRMTVGAKSYSAKALMMK